MHRKLAVCFFAALAAAFAQELADPGFLLKARQARTRRVSFMPRRFTPGQSHSILAFRARPSEEELAGLASRGVRVTGVLSGSALVASAPDGVELENSSRFEPADKISPEVGEWEADLFVVEFHSDVDMDRAREMVAEEEFERLDHPDLLASQLLVRAPAESVIRLSAWDEVDYIFPASSELRNGDRVAACAGAFAEWGIIGQYVKVGNGWPAPTGSFGGASSLGYVFGPMTAKIPVATAQAEIVRALGEWSKYGKIQFSPGLSPGDPRTVYIFFASRVHGDPFPFDGPGRVLAHTFYPSPPNGEPLGGDMHLDEEEAWRIGNHTDLFSVALHEAGHAIGLGHSDKPGAVMYPYYRMVSGLAADDIQGVQSLYGAAAGSGTPSQPTDLAPVLALAITTPSASTSAASMALQGTSSGAARLSWSNDRGGSGAIAVAANWSAGSIALAAGENLLTVTAAGSAGAALARSVRITRVVETARDTTPPSLQITSPASTIVSTRAATIALTGTASDQAGVASVRWACSCGVSGVAAGTANWSVSAAPIRVGTNYMTVRAYDASGNSSWRTVTVVRR